MFLVAALNNLHKLVMYFLTLYKPDDCLGYVLNTVCHNFSSPAYDQDILEKNCCDQAIKDTRTSANILTGWAIAHPVARV